MRGQSEVVAALLMTAIVLVGFAIVWVYLYPRYLEWEQQASNTALESRLAASEWLVIGNTVFGSDRLDLTLVNTGGVELKVRAVYVNESLAWQGSLSLAPGGKGEVSAPLPRGGRVFWIKVCTARGNCWTFLEVNLTAPAAPPPPPPSPAPPFFQFASYDSVVYGQPGSQASFNAEVENRGGTGGYAVVGLYDETSRLIASRTVYVPAGTRAPVALSFSMPASPGVYTWHAQLNNSYTGEVDQVVLVTLDVTHAPPPAFKITDYNSTVSGAPGTSLKFVVSVINTGGSSGSLTVEVYNHTGGLAASASVDSLQPGATARLQFLVTAPQQPGNYTWSVRVYNNYTDAYDDEKNFFVIAASPLFAVTAYNSTVYGLPGSSANLVVEVTNTGNLDGSCVVEVYNHQGSLVASSSIHIPAGSSERLALTVALPGSKGTYSWSIKALNSYTGKYDDVKNFTVMTLDLSPPDTSAVLFYSLFEALPSGWGSIGGAWSIVGGVGWEGSNALRGVDNNRGPRSTSVYYWSNNIDGFSTIKALVKLGGVSQGDNIARGFALLDRSNRNARFYRVIIQPIGANIQLSVIVWDGRNTRTLGTVTVSYSTSWYILYLEYTRGSGSFYAVLYGENSAQLATLQASDTSVDPRYFGLLVDGGAAVFDDLVVATGDPRYVTVSGLTPGWVVELWRGSTLVASGAADASGTVRLSVTRYPIIQSAMLVIKDQQGAVVIRKTLDVVVGGYTYYLDP
uniref:CARDB domain-containing protein n=1 Tax=Thermofilum pendens TaxID=2269 RepID=A0A7C3WMP9_THEPE